MAFAITRSSRNRELFSITNGDQESVMEFPFKDAQKHLRHAKQFTKWVTRISSKKKTQTIKEDS